MSTATTTPEVAAAPGMLSATTIFYSLLVPALVLFYAYWRISRRHLLELAEKIPGPPGVPLFGNALELIGSSPGMLFFLNTQYAKKIKILFIIFIS